MRKYGIVLEGVELYAYDPEDGTPAHLHRVPLFLVCERFGIDTDYQAKLLQGQGLDLRLDRLAGRNGMVRETRTLPLADILIWVVAAAVRPRKDVPAFMAWRTRVRDNLRSLIQNTMGTPLDAHHRPL